METSVRLITSSSQERTLASSPLNRVRSHIVTLMAIARVTKAEHAVPVKLNHATLLLLTLALVACSRSGMGRQETDVPGSMVVGPATLDPQGTALFVAKRAYDAKDQIHYWIDNYRTCGPDRPEGYFAEQFRPAFDGQEWTSYALIRGKEPVITIATVSNALGYDSLEKAREDFYMCDSGIPRPVAVNRDWIVLALNAASQTNDTTHALAEKIIASIRLQ